MPMITYIDKTFQAQSLAVIDQACEIIHDYAAQGFTLTLRQLYYQFVARDLLPNTQRSYSRLGSIINDARLAGYVDWSAIEDRTRFVREQANWSSPASIVRSCAAQFRYDKWSDQDMRLEVWIEKDALVGVIEGVCNELAVPFLSCRGYVSQSALWRASQRFEEYAAADQHVLVIHLGDHDPSGIDMTRDVGDRFELFADDANVNVRRIALNRDQVDQYGPPPNPAKLGDSRAGGYIARHGYESWELDALEPRVIADLIRLNIEGERDDAKWYARVDEENAARKQLRTISDNWGDILGEWT